jgi:acyl-CoA reductase-like NAD-dependent aldehyde dehydrogenase
VPVDDIDAAIKHINAGEKPLALYVFSQDKKLQEHSSSDFLFLNLIRDELAL